MRSHVTAFASIHAVLQLVQCAWTCGRGCCAARYHHVLARTAYGRRTVDRPVDLAVPGITVDDPRRVRLLWHCGLPLLRNAAGSFIPTPAALEDMTLRGHAAVNLALPIAAFTIDDRPAIHAVDEILVELVGCFAGTPARTLLVSQNRGREDDGYQR